jgi:hypothetical protein
MVIAYFVWSSINMIRRKEFVVLSLQIKRFFITVLSYFLLLYDSFIVLMNDSLLIYSFIGQFLLLKQI